MTPVTRFAAVAICALTALHAPPPAGAAEPAPPKGGAAPRTLAVIPFYAPERMWQLYAPFAEFLARETGEPWKLQLPASHDALLDDLCAGRVDVALLGPIPLARANKRCGVVPLLVALGPDGTASYHSILVTTDPSVTDPRSLAGKEIGFFKGSTAAHVVPVQMLAEAGVPPGTYVPVFLESQDRIMAALLARKIAGAGVKSALFRRFETEQGLRKIGTSAPLPNFALAVLPSLPRAARDRFEAAMAGFQPKKHGPDAELAKVLDDEIRHGFARPPDGYLAAVQALNETSERFLRDGQ
jgi:ABC-type phosphate/phosphonate transport system substrate-binding protein